MMGHVFCGSGTPSGIKFIPWRGDRKILIKGEFVREDLVKRCLSVLILAVISTASAFALPQAQLTPVKLTHQPVKHHKAHKAGKHHAPKHHRQAA
jgi:hypothetical protein